MEYKFRAGQKVRILEVESLGDRCAWAGKEVTLSTQDTWDEPAWSVKEPDCYYRFRESEMALAGPVRTETITRTVIEPGVYGRVRVGTDQEGWANIAIVPAHERNNPEWEVPGDQQRSLNSTELRELARIATELADGLDAQ